MTPPKFFSITTEGTHPILLINSSAFDYMERKNNERQDIITTHTLDNYPKDLSKKVTLLQHFKTYLEAEAKLIPVIRTCFS